MTDDGWETIEKLLGIGNIADAENWELKHYVETAIKAHALYKRDVDYVVKDGEVIIVDTFTGRLMPGRRWSDGLHQSIEAKEGVNIRKEDQTLATITFQNYFRLYRKLSGMTGTAETEAAEFEKIYKLEIVVIPTNNPSCATRIPTSSSAPRRKKYKAAADDIATFTRRSSRFWSAPYPLRRGELLSGILRRKDIATSYSTPSTTNAKPIRRTGRHLGMVTIATNMAGRGTDILLGGNAEFHGTPGTGDEGPPAPSASPRVPSIRSPSEAFRVSTSMASWKFMTPTRPHLHSSQERGRTEGARRSHCRTSLFILGARAPRVAPHRRPASSPRWPPGRSAAPRASIFSLEDDLMHIFAKQSGPHACSEAGCGRSVSIGSKMIFDGILRRPRPKPLNAQNFRSRRTSARVRRRDCR